MQHVQVTKTHLVGKQKHPADQAPILFSRLFATVSGDTATALHSPQSNERCYLRSE